MPTYTTHDDAEPLPHASLLAYLRLCTPTSQDKRTTPPPYRLFDTIHEVGGVDEDEEPHGSSRSDSFSSRSVHAFYACLTLSFTVISYTVYLIAMVFGIDLIAAQFGLDMGLAKWVVLGENRSYDMHFCLASPDRQVPGPQTWRYANEEGIAACANEVLTLSASSTEMWKMIFGDEISFGEDLWRRKADERRDEIGKEELGDDLAREGVDRVLDVYPRRDRRF